MQKTIAVFLFVGISSFASSQTPDSIVAIKQIDSLLQQLTPLLRQQKQEEALKILDLAQQKSREIFGEQHLSYGTCLAFRGKIAQQKENYREAADYYVQAMRIQEKALGKESQQYAISGNTLGSIYTALGEFGKAEPLLLETKATRAKLVGRKHPDYGRVLNNLGLLYYHKGNYGQAELQFLEAIEVYTNSIGTRNPDYVSASANLGTVYIERGDHDKAELVYLGIRNFFADGLGKQHPLYAKATGNLATIYSRKGELVKAKQLYLELKDLYTNVLGQDKIGYVEVLVNLAVIYQEEGDYAGTEHLLLEAKDRCIAIFGQEHWKLARILKNLGILAAIQGNAGQAEKWYAEAIAMFKRTLPPGHPDYNQTISLLALLYQERGRFSEAAALFLEAAKLNRRLIEHSAGYSSEAEMFRYLQTFRVHTDQFYRFVQARPQPDVAAAAYDNALFYNGFLLNASRQVKNRALLDPAAALKFEALRSCRHRLSIQYLLPFAEQDTARLVELEREANLLEKDLVRMVVGFGDALRQVNWKEVQAALEQGEAAIEFVHYQYLDLLGKPSDTTLYAALVLRPGDAAPKFVSLFEEHELSALLKGAEGGNYRKINALYGQGGAGQKNLYDLLWSKLEAALAGTNKVYCSLSGLLYRINLGAVSRNVQETFSDRRQLVVLGSTRQLVFRERDIAAENIALLVGGVRYAENDSIETSVTRTRSISGSADPENLPFEADSLTRGDPWQFLPGSAAEVLALRDILQSAGMQVRLDTGYSATEESVKENNAPRILHLATHGYFFPDAESVSVGLSAPGDLAFKSSQNPLLRSGLILAGAQQVWTTGKPPAGREDGVLTAYEISRMDMSGTELVVLSACETGLGDIEGNEGVYGLQRAFKIAGVKYVVMSLWKVNDQTTHEFMAYFYTEWLQNRLSLPEAFGNAQHRMKKKYPTEPYHWAGFVLVE